MLKNYFICLPSLQGSLEDEWEQCRRQIIKIISIGNKPLKLNIFVDQSDYQSFLDTKEAIILSVTETFGAQIPALNVTAHPPEKPWKIAVEAAFIIKDDSELIYRIWNSIPYVVRISDYGKEIWANGLGEGLFPTDTSKAAEAAFDQMRMLLEAENMSFNHLVRQWNYIGNILRVKDEFQNYQLFNEVRNKNYKKYRTIPGYPAATGVGMKHGGVKLDFYAVNAEKSMKIIAVNNPDQVKPYAYGQQVLKGIPLSGTEKKQAPQFERAVLLSNGLSKTILISGTASIIGEDTIGIGDIEKQTKVTIKNIRKLYNNGSVGILTGHSDKDNRRVILLRVYIKDQDDFAKVRSICESYYPDVPTVYIEADICRDDLLVEIEAEISEINY